MTPRKIFIIAGIAAVIFYLLGTNPTNDDFEAYLNKHKISDVTEKRDFNLFLCSFYSANDITYLAIADHFVGL